MLWLLSLLLPGLFSHLHDFWHCVFLFDPLLNENQGVFINKQRIGMACMKGKLGWQQMGDQHSRKSISCSRIKKRRLSPWTRSPSIFSLKLGF